MFGFRVNAVLRLLIWTVSCSNSKTKTFKSPTKGPFEHSFSAGDRIGLLWRNVLDS